MAKSLPKSLPLFRRWLEARINELSRLCGVGESDFFDEVAIAGLVEDASGLACRFGLGLAVDRASVSMKPFEGMAILGRILSRLLERVEPQTELLSDTEVGKMLGVSRRTVWRRNSAREIPSPIKVGSLTKWRRVEIEAMIGK